MTTTPCLTMPVGTFIHASLAPPCILALAISESVTFHVALSGYMDRGESGS